MPVPAPERRAAGIILAVFLAAIILPYLIAPQILPAGTVWGGLLGSVDDQNVHLMWARQARDGGFFIRDLYTTEGLLTGERPLFFNILPLAIGLLSRITSLEVAFPYHVLRVTLAAWALWQVHLLSLAATNHDVKWSRARILGLGLLAFTTGSGVLAPLLDPQRFFLVDRADGNFPMMPEAYFALSAFAYPLNIASYGLLAWIVRLVIGKKGAPQAFLAGLLLANIHTYDALPLVLTLLIWSAWKRQGLAVSTAAIVGAALPILYQVMVFRGSEEFRIKALTVTAPPGAISMFLAYAGLIVLAIFALRKWKELPAIPLLVIWTLATFALVYAPTSLFSFARKMIEGVQIPLALLAGVGLSELVGYVAKPGARKALAGVVLAWMSISPLQYLGWIWNNTLDNNFARASTVSMPQLALLTKDAGALQAIDKQTGQGAVLCSILLGAYVPRATGKFTYVGHWAETLHREDKTARMVRFYSGQMGKDDALKFLRENRIRWVVESPIELSAGQGQSASQNLGLKSIYREGDDQTGFTSVYEVPAA